MAGIVDLNAEDACNAPLQKIKKSPILTLCSENPCSKKIVVQLLNNVKTKHLQYLQNRFHLNFIEARYFSFYSVMMERFF